MTNIHISHSVLVSVVRLLTLALFLLIQADCAQSQTHREVDRVVDGDTFVLAGGDRVRLIGIDTPESVHPHEPPEPFGHEASQFLKSLIEGKSVRLEFDAQERDRYGRLLAYVYLQDGTFLNALLVREGYAMILTVPPNVKHSGEFLKLQQEARENRRGIWGGNE